MDKEEKNGFKKASKLFFTEVGRMQKSMGSSYAREGILFLNVHAEIILSH